MKRLLFLSLLILSLPLKGMEVAPATPPELSYMPAEIIASITSMVADADTPFAAVENVRNLLIGNKSFSKLLNDAKVMGDVAQNIANKFENLSFLNALLLLNTPGSKLAYQQELEYQNIKVLLEETNLNNIDKLNTIIIALKDKLLANEKMRRIVIASLQKQAGVNSISDYVNIFTGKEDPALLEILFKGKEPLVIKKEYKNQLQNLLLKAVYAAKSPPLVEMLLGFEVDVNAMASSEILSQSGKLRVLEGKTPLESLFLGVVNACSRPDYLQTSQAATDFIIMQKLLKAGAKAPKESVEDFYKKCPDQRFKKLIESYKGISLNKL